MMNCQCPCCGKAKIDVGSHRRLSPTGGRCVECKNEFKWRKSFLIASNLIEDVCIIVAAIFISLKFKADKLDYSISYVLIGLGLIFLFLRLCDLFYKLIPSRFTVRCVNGKAEGE